MELQSRLEALAGNFAHAIALVEATQICPASKLLEKLRIFERQGRFKLAKKTVDLMPTNSARPHPLAAAHAYVKCITDGAWLNALQEVSNIFADLLLVGGHPDLEMLVVGSASTLNCYE